eukprot:Tbor_TRINITY_DN4665_c0_g1::TRINITY_DN4665_c0_g1_i1::g.14881::m.14881/K20028/ZDHHC2_15_20; palmitoyltransferase ZDHHC2/15/20
MVPFDRFYVSIIILFGCWSTYTYFTYCFTDVINAVSTTTIVTSEVTTVEGLDVILHPLGHIGARITPPVVLKIEKNITDENTRTNAVKDSDTKRHKGRKHHHMYYHQRFTTIVIRDLIWLLISIYVVVMVVWSYAATALTDPGIVPRCFHITERGSDKISLITTTLTTKCNPCGVYKPPRTHHCSSCERCVLKYDHHCSAVGTCIGFYNYKPYFLLCVWTTVYSYVASFSLTRSVFLYITRHLADASSEKTQFHKITLRTEAYINSTPVFGSTEVIYNEMRLEIVVLFALLTVVGSLACYLAKVHYYLITSNKSSLEHMIISEESGGAEVPSPYDLGEKYNVEEVFGDRNFEGSLILKYFLRSIPFRAHGVQIVEEIYRNPYFYPTGEVSLVVSMNGKSTSSISNFGACDRNDIIIPKGSSDTLLLNGIPLPKGTYFRRAPWHTDLL